MHRWRASSDTAREESYCAPAGPGLRVPARKGQAVLATAGTVVLLQPPFPLVCVSIVQEKGCQHFYSNGIS